MKILMCHDGSGLAQSALERVVAMLKELRPEFVVVTVAEEPADASSYDESSFQQWRKERETELERACDLVTGNGLAVDAVLAVGEPRKMLMEAIRKKNPDLVVITSRAASETGYRFGNVTVSVSSYLLRHVRDCPVMVMH